MSHLVERRRNYWYAAVQERKNVSSFFLLSLLFFAHMYTAKWPLFFSLLKDDVQSYLCVWLPDEEFVSD